MSQSQEAPSVSEQPCCAPTCYGDDGSIMVSQQGTEVEGVSEKVKELVKERYAQIAVKAGTGEQPSCCTPTGCGADDVAVVAEDYSTLEGYVPEADLGLGCGLPTGYAKITPGETVLDLGSGAGNDAFIVRSILGETGKVIGVDMTEAMVEKARANNAKLGFQNVEFVLGEIEALPLASESVDLVLSNCVLNLVPNKAKAFSEIYRVLKPGGRFSISDIVTTGKLPTKMRAAAEMYAGCIGGALVKEDYLAVVKTAGFMNVSVVKEKRITVPITSLQKYLEEAEVATFQNSGAGIISITVYGEKESKGGGTKSRR